MRKIFALAILNAFVVAAPDDAEYMKFIAKHNKHYKTQREMTRRKQNWKAAMQQVTELNSSGDTATYAMNFTGDLDDAEYKNMLGLLNDKVDRNLEELPLLDDETHLRELQTINPNIDWSIQGKGNAPPVKDQGACGACWAFAATSVLESAISIKKTGTGVLVPPVRLSEQQLVDCTLAYKNNGCSGGLTEKAWQYAKDKGLMLDADYPYTSGTTTKTGATCNFNAAKPIQKVLSYGPLISAPNASSSLISKGPIAISIAVERCNNFRYYTKGYLSQTPSSCQSTTSWSLTDHAVMIVGHETLPSGTQTCQTAQPTEITNKKCTFSTMTYFAATDTSAASCCKTSTVEKKVWKIQNTWGTAWGDQGFIRFERMDIGTSSLPYGICNMNYKMQQVFPLL